MIASLLVTVVLSVAPSKPASAYELDPATFVAMAKSDLVSLRRFVQGMETVATTVKANQQLFSASTDRIYDREQKQLLLSTWGSLFAFFSATEGLRQKYWDFVKLSPLDPRHAWGFLLTHTALTALLSHGLQFANETLGNKQLETLFDEANDEFGVPRGAFASFKVKSIHVATTTQLVTGELWSNAPHVALETKPGPEAENLEWALAEMKRDTALAKAALTTAGVKLFGVNAKDIVKTNTAQAIFPVQKSFAEWAGDTRVARQGKPLITRAQIDALVLPKLQPGDVLVARQNWFLSNIGLPGFWPHALLFVGTPTELKATFDENPEVKAWALSQPEKAAGLSELLAKRFPSKWKRYTTGPDFQNHAPIRVIESISEGVSFTAVEHAFGVDYLAAMRPTVSPLEKARAIERAFAYVGRPYDFDFDFFSDTSLVCTELVYKSYQPSAQMKGVPLDLVDVAGRRTLPANDIVRQYDSALAAPGHPLEFVLFIDAKEKTAQAFEATADAFRSSWKRVKWDVAQK